MIGAVLCQNFMLSLWFYTAPPHLIWVVSWFIFGVGWVAVTLFLFYYSREGVCFIKEIKEDKDDASLYHVTIDKQKTKDFYKKNPKIETQHKDFVDTVTDSKSKIDAFAYYVLGNWDDKPNEFSFIKVRNYIHIACLQRLCLRHTHCVQISRGLYLISSVQLICRYAALRQWTKLVKYGSLGKRGFMTINWEYS